MVIAGSGPLLLAVADTVNKAGGEVTSIIEQAPLPALLRFAGGLWRWPQKLRQLATLAPKGYLSGTQVIRAHGTTRLEAVTLRQRGVERTIACDRLAIGYGLIPNIETALLFGCATAQEAIQVNRWQQTSIADIYAAGECTGFGGSELALAEGEIAGFCRRRGQPSSAGVICPPRPLAALRRRHKSRLPAGGIFEKRGDAGEPAVPLRGCALRRWWRPPEAGRRPNLPSAAEWGRLSGAHLRRQRPLVVWLAAGRSPREPLAPARAETLIALARLSAEP
ncbi:Putative oxidoreductase in 4-hydroxyproline catabolic gene cluster [Klebsiella aerogenes]|nr:Putative oxidoreductase in 4-hydroxyproline catabolic gene cluster [Klebsiella aerogenes]